MSLWGLARTLAIVAIASATAVVSASQQQPPDKPKPKPPDTGLIAGRVTDATTERPIAGALVVTFTERGEAAVLTNGAGQFVLDRLPAGAYVLFLSKAGYVPGRYGQEAASSGGGAALMLTPAGRITDVAIRLWKRAAITGRVVDERGDPLVEVEVAATRMGDTTAVAANDMLTDVEDGEWFDPAFLDALMPAAIKISLGSREKKVQDIRIGG